MPNRILKESICTSESVEQLTQFEEIFFYRLIVNCDDFGRFDARPAVLKARLFPLKEKVTLKEVESALVGLANAGIVIMYEVDNKPYLHLPTWDVHQTIRAKKSRYPDPGSGMITSESRCKHMQSNAIKCNQMQADASICSRNPIQSESNPIRESESESKRDADFDKFWTCYPRKVGKGVAKKAFTKVKTPLETLLNALETQKLSKQWQKDGGQYIPNPATWLNQERWNDDLGAQGDSAPKSAKPTGSAKFPNATTKDLERMKRLLADMRGGE